MEQWKSIKDYEGIYLVSNYGRIKREEVTIVYKYKNEYRGRKYNDNIVKQTTKHGYQYVELCNGSNKKHYRVHRLVAQAFIPNPSNKPQVNHKDLNKINNKVSNLEWVTAKENIIHAMNSKKNNV